MINPDFILGGLVMFSGIITGYGMCLGKEQSNKNKN